MATVGQLQDDIANELASQEFNSTQGGMSSPVFHAINAAVQELASTAFTFNIVTNAYQLINTENPDASFSGGIRQVLGVFLYDQVGQPVKWELEAINIHDLGNFSTAYTGAPRFYCVVPQTISTVTSYFMRVRPIPDKDYYLNVVRISDYVPYTALDTSDIWTNQGYYLTKSLAKYNIYSTILVNPQQAAMELALFNRLKYAYLSHRDSIQASNRLRSIW